MMILKHNEFRSDVLGYHNCSPQFRLDVLPSSDFRLVVFRQDVLHPDVPLPIMADFWIWYRPPKNVETKIQKNPGFSGFRAQMTSSARQIECR